MSNSFVESNEYLASPDGQRSGMPPKVGPGHPLGPYAPRPCGSMVATAPDEAWLPSPDGQRPGGAGYASSPAPETRSVQVPKGNSTDETHLPSPDGQYGSTYKG